MSKETCPSCGAQAAGRFCDQCGVALGGGRCRECDAQLPRGGRFCNQCGAPVAGVARQEAGPAPRAALLPWVLFAVGLVVIVLLVVAPRLGREGGDPPFAGPVPGGAQGASAVDLSSMTPREPADRLFNRVMQSVASGDTGQAQQFLPMALDAYRMVPDLDADGRYHLAVLQLVAGQHAAARAQADTILQANGNHLFGLFTAAQAERARGNRAEAQRLFRRFLEVYPEEAGRELPEYLDHQQAFPSMRQEAESETGQAVAEPGTGANP